MEVRAGNMGVTYKEDKSPVTIADQAAEKIILKDLKSIAPEIPVIAEESASDGIIPDVDDIFWLVDPLDGTKEFISGGTDFTVNIALIEKGAPTFGIIFAPARDKIYIAKNPDEAIMQDVKEYKLTGEEQPIHVRDLPENNITAVASKSHMDEKTAAFLKEHNIENTASVGSSLKFCIVASGEADIYPRFGPTMEWDIAAGHAILRAAGGTLTNPDMTPFEYKKKGYLNGPFIANGKMKL